MVVLNNLWWHGEQKTNARGQNAFNLIFWPLQQFQVDATETLNPLALEADIDCALATEKLDGTCCYVTDYKGEKNYASQICFKSFMLN